MLSMGKSKGSGEYLTRPLHPENDRSMNVYILRETGIRLLDGTVRNSVVGETVSVPYGEGMMMLRRKSACLPEHAPKPPAPPQKATRKKAAKKKVAASDEPEDG